MSGKFRASKWDPILIFAQIITLQALFYSSFGFLVSFVDFATADPPSIGHIFSYHVYSIKSFHNVLIVLCFIINAALG